MTLPDLSSYTIVFSKSAEKSLRSLDKSTQKKVLEKIRQLQSNSQNLDIKKLKSRYQLYRLRIGTYRVIYSLEHERVIIYIITVGHRKEIYERADFA